MAALLKNKNIIPTQSSKLIERSRLLEKLENYNNARLIFIGAPAGFGKTTLLSDWALRKKSTGYPIAWFSLDEADQDPQRFWSYFIESLLTIPINFRDSTISPFYALFELQPETSLIPLINEMADFKKEFIVILDDYHLINSKSINMGINFLLNNIPSNMHLIIASRSEIPFQIARLRARQQIIEIDASDLRFNLDEVHQFLEEIMHLNLSKEDTDLINTRIEGWIAGLQMAGLTIKDRGNISRLVESVTEGNDFIFDYLAEEVLNAQSEDIQEFLLKTSILSELTGPLCERVTKQSDGFTTLQQLEKANLFIFGIDSKHIWYRYHHLFAGYLQKCLRQRMPTVIPEIHSITAEWLAENNYIEEAVTHALLAKNYSLAI